MWTQLLRLKYALNYNKICLCYMYFSYLHNLGIKCNCMLYVNVGVRLTVFNIFITYCLNILIAKL